MRLLPIGIVLGTIAAEAAADEPAEPIGVAVVVSARGAGGPRAAALVEQTVCEELAPVFACAPADAVAAVVGPASRTGPDTLAMLTDELDLPYALAVAIYPGETDDEVDVEVLLHVQGRETGIFRSGSAVADEAGEVASEISSGLLNDAEARGLSRGGSAAAAAAAAGAGAGAGRDDSGTIDLVINETLQGILLAWASTQAVDVEDARAVGPILLLGGTAGFASSLLASHYLAIDQAEAQVVAGGGWWGFAEGILLAKVVGETEWCNTWAWSILGWGVGAGTGITLAATVDIGRGDAALINSAALWGLFAGAMLGGTILGRDLFTTQTDYYYALPFAGLNAGVLTGVIASRWVDVSRGRMALIDLSGILGSLLGGSLATPLIIENPTENQKRSYSAIMLASAALGLGLGILFTGDMDEPSEGAIAAAMIEVEPDGEIDLGVPMPRPIVAPPAEGSGRPALGLWVPLALGAW